MKFIIFLIINLTTNYLYAEITVKSNCYETSVLRDSKNQPIYLLINSYFDTKLNIEIASLAKYKFSKDYINLAFISYKKTDEDEPNLANFEYRRVEIINGKATGEYALIKTGAGIKQGEFLEYKNYKSKKIVIFFETNNIEKCF
jgi:hypothetical protein